MKPKTILIGLSILVLLVVIGISAVSLLFTKWTQMTYPKAPPMPPVVSQSMEEILVQLESELKSKAPQVLTNLQPGLSMDRINELEKQSGIQIPDDLKALYHWHNGFNRAVIPAIGFASAGPMPNTYFVPLDEALMESSGSSHQMAGATPVQRAAFDALAGFTKSWIPLFDDGTGDGYFYDPKRKPEDGTIFYHVMEEGDYIFFPSPKNLFAGLVKCYQQNVFTWKEGTNGISVDEDFQASRKIWNEFGVDSTH